MKNEKLRGENYLGSRSYATSFGEVRPFRAEDGGKDLLLSAGILLIVVTFSVNIPVIFIITVPAVFNGK